MSDANFRRELNAAFDRIAGAPGPALRERVRASLSEAPPARGGTYWIAALAACVIGAVIVAVLLTANPLNRPPITAGPPPATAAPSASAPPSVASTPTPGSGPTPSASNPPPFTCTSSPAMTSSQAAAIDYVEALRTGTHAGYDRVTIELANGRPSSIEVTGQASATFVKSPSGQTVTLLGRSGILVTIRGADMHTSYSGPRDLRTGYPALVEVAQVQDYEGVVQIALGVNGPACYRAFMLSGPTRLVIDVQNGA